MTQRAEKNLKALAANTRRYSAVVEKRLSKTAGSSKRHQALVESAAKYYPALKKLANE